MEKIKRERGRGRIGDLNKGERHGRLEEVRGRLEAGWEREREKE